MSARIGAVIAIPVLNEEKVLRGTVSTIRAFSDRALPEYDVTIVVADNGSDDATEAIGRELAATLPGMRYLRLQERGKGLAIRSAWESVPGEIYAFMDADLSTDIDALPELFRRVREGAGVATGSRCMDGSRVERSLFRRTLSAGYRTLLRLALGTRIGDAPCGFKAVSATVVRDVVPEVRNTTWFFDSELVLRAERKGLRIEEVPVAWHDLRTEGRISRVRIWRLVKEYCKEAARLRRDLGARPRAAVGPSLDRRERNLILIVSAALIIATSIAPMYGVLHGREIGLEWTGRTHFAPGDLAAYLSQIAQAKQGTFFFENMATTERLIPAMNTVWGLIGSLARIFDLSSLAAYHLGRVLLIPFGVWALYSALAWFVSDKRVRAIALLLLCFGSGMGTIAAPFLTVPASNGVDIEWPIDAWVAEANVFASFSFSPHFIASWALLILALFLLSRALARRNLRDAALAGLAGFGLFSFHPFYIPTVCAVGMAWLALWILRRGFVWRDAAVLVVAGLLALPSAAYQIWLVAFTRNKEFMLDTNTLWSPSFPFVMLGFGGFLLLAPFSFLEARRSNREDALRAEELAVWAFLNVLLAYAPISFQRRLLEGVEFPLAALSAWGVFAIYHGIAKTRRFRATAYACVSLLLYAVFMPTTLYHVSRDVREYETSAVPFSYRLPEQSAALSWIREQSPLDAVFLSQFITGNDIFGWGERRVYQGHWAFTIDQAMKKTEVEGFFGTMTSERRRTFLLERGITHVFVGPLERVVGAELDADPGLTPAFQEGEITIYQVR